MGHGAFWHSSIWAWSFSAWCFLRLSTSFIQAGQIKSRSHCSTARSDVSTLVYLSLLIPPRGEAICPETALVRALALSPPRPSRSSGTVELVHPADDFALCHIRLGGETMHQRLSPLKSGVRVVHVAKCLNFAAPPLPPVRPPISDAYVIFSRWFLYIHFASFVFLCLLAIFCLSVLSAC